MHSIDFDAARGEIGYVGDVRLSGRGLMREAVRTVIAVCFDIGFERIEAMSDARNARACTLPTAWACCSARACCAATSAMSMACPATWCCGRR